MNPAAPVTRTCKAGTLLAARTGVVDLAAMPLELLGAVEVLQRLATLVLLGVGLVELARALELSERLACDRLGLAPSALAEERRGLVRQLDAALARRRRWRGRRRWHWRRRFGSRRNRHVRRDGLAFARDGLALDDGARLGLVAPGHDGGHRDATAEQQECQEQEQWRSMTPAARGDRRGELLRRRLERATEVADEGPGARIAPIGILGERALEDRVELRRRRGDRRVDMCRGLGGWAVGLEWTTFVKQLPGDDPEGIAVAGRRGALPLSLLRREVARGPEHCPRHRQRVEADGACDAEVRDVNVAPPVEQQVAGLDVAVDDACRMRGV